MEQHVEEIFSKGLSALENGHIYLALSCFEQAATLDRTPLNCSYLALCLAVPSFPNPSVSAGKR